MTSPRSLPADALAVAYAAAGLDSSGAEVIYQRANTVYKLASAPVVARLRYTSGSDAVPERLSASVRATRWLHEQGFPTVRPLDVPQPVAAHGYQVTFWHHIPSAGQAGRDVVALGRLLRQLHALPVPPVRLPATNPLGSIRADAAACQWLSDAQRRWLTGRCDELWAQYADAESALGCGVVHGDAHPGNLIHAPGRVVLCDWDAVSYGPREQDLIPIRLGYRYGRPAAEWPRLCEIYQADPGGLPLLPLLERMRELRAVAAYLRLPDLPQARAEASHRIGDLMSGTQREPWRALNLALRQADDGCLAAARPPYRAQAIALWWRKRRGSAQERQCPPSRSAWRISSGSLVITAYTPGRAAPFRACAARQTPSHVGCVVKK